MSEKIDHLYVIWNDLERDRRYVVGHLARAADRFRFHYDEALAEAEAAGFVRLSMFPDVREYESDRLFPPFAERIPSKARPDAAAMFAAWGVDDVDDPFEILARSHGIRATDRIELDTVRAAASSDPQVASDNARRTWDANQRVDSL